MIEPSDPVLELLLTCLRSRWDPSALELLRSMLSPVDGRWLEVAEHAAREQVAALIFRPLQPLGDLLPSAVREILSTEYYRHAVRNTLFLDEISQVLRRLRAVQIETVALKGLALAEGLYQDPAVRPMSDGDLLIHRRDLPMALRVLSDAGFEPDAPEPRHGLFAEFENELVLSKRDPCLVRVELHWHLIDSPYYQRTLAPDWIWGSTRPAMVGGEPTLVLGREVQVLYLCAHMLLHHRNPRLLWLHDLGEFMARSGSRIHWDDLLLQAQQHELVLPTQRILPTVVSGWQVSNPPAAVLKQLSQLSPSVQEHRAFEWLTASEQTVARRFYADLTSLGRWSRRLRYAAAHLFPQAAYMQQRYRISRPALVPLYYPYRWLLGLRAVGQSLVRRR